MSMKWTLVRTVNFSSQSVITESRNCIDAELLQQLLVEVRGLRDEKRKSEGGTKELAAAYAAIVRVSTFLTSFFSPNLLTFVWNALSRLH